MNDRYEIAEEADRRDRTADERDRRQHQPTSTWT
jgi:hypothetical protein